MVSEIFLQELQTVLGLLWGSSVIHRSEGLDLLEHLFPVFRPARPPEGHDEARAACSEERFFEFSGLPGIPAGRASEGEPLPPQGLHLFHRYVPVVPEDPDDVGRNFFLRSPGFLAMDLGRVSFPD